MIRCLQESLHCIREFVRAVLDERVERMPETGLAENLKRRAAHPREHVQFYRRTSSRSPSLHSRFNGLTSLYHGAQKSVSRGGDVNSAAHLVNNLEKDRCHIPQVLDRKHRIKHLTLPLVLSTYNAEYDDRNLLVWECHLPAVLRSPGPTSVSICLFAKHAQ